jgi:hypothetical protein
MLYEPLDVHPFDERMKCLGDNESKILISSGDLDHLKSLNEKEKLQGLLYDEMGSQKS